VLSEDAQIGVTSIPVPATLVKTIEVGFGEFAQFVLIFIVMDWVVPLGSAAMDPRQSR
jgi:hypothetical protein